MSENKMSEESFKMIANLLRKPEGNVGIEISNKMNDGNKIINLETIKKLDLKDNHSILEIGMGNGFFVKDIFENNNITYQGCDYSKEMVEEASKNNNKLVESGKAKFLFAEANSLPYENDQFERIFTINTIYFWEDHKKVLSEINRVLKNKGKLIISLRPKKTMKEYPFVKYGFKMFDKKEINQLLIDNGFHVIDSIQINEPDREINGMKMKVDTLIIIAEKLNK